MFGSSYSAADKSLTSSGTTGEIRLGSLPTTTITQLSFSFWINPSGDAPLVYHGYEATGRRISLSVDQSGLGLFFAISANYIQKTSCLTLGQWQHVSIVFLGGSIGSSLADGSAVYKLYINGVDTSWTGGLFNAGTLQLENGHPFVLMNGLAGTSGTGAIKLSNFKYYDTALTAEEVKTLYDMGRTGSVANPQPLHIAAPLYSPGLPVQCISDTVHDMVVYASAAEYYLTPLEIQITPKFSNSKIQLQWTINYEATEHSGFRIYRDSTLIGYNKNTSTSSTWNTIAVSPYDAQTVNTPANITIAWVDTPNTTGTVTYKLLSHTTYVGSQPFYLNRAQSGTGSAYVENMVSYKSAVEIAQ
tara:strand:+ start:60 stop:1136 length:1077 start_codon:yes stop_codon:yes gene_type:complete